MVEQRPIDMCKKHLEEILIQARLERKSYQDIVAGELHKEVFGSPAVKNRMPTCCDAMYGSRIKHDILYAPPKGKGSRLAIRYYLA